MELDCTNILHAISEIIALLGAIAAFYVLLKKDKQRAEQIGKIALLAEKLTEQNAWQQKMYELENNKFKLSIMPLIDFIPNQPAAYQQDNDLKIIFINKGETAKNVLVSGNLDENSNIRLTPCPFPDIENGDLFEVTLKGTPELFQKEWYEFEITYKDINGNKYKNTVRGIGTKVGITPAEEVTKK